jgi:hypothetical protein
VDRAQSVKAPEILFLGTNMADNIRARDGGAVSVVTPTRVQLDLHPSKVEEIERFMDLADISTRKQYFDYALTVFKWALSQAREGRTIAALDTENGNYRELSMPPLDHVRLRPEVRQRARLAER